MVYSLYQLRSDRSMLRFCNLQYSQRRCLFKHALASEQVLEFGAISTEDIEKASEAAT